MTPERLAPAERDAALADLPRWRWDEAGHALQREYHFPDFTAAFAFMARVALHAEKVDHHPDWSNRYDRVDVRLTTHDAGGVTARDVAFARAIDGWG